MLNDQGFDLWANGYDKSVALSEESNEYPFAGYGDVLNFIYNGVRRGPGKRVLDVGIGTGVLAQKLYGEGYAICGVDFSEKMLALAGAKMPHATLIKHDFSKGLPKALEGDAFDSIVCTYAIHHLKHEEKLGLLRALCARLNPGGTLFVGDVAFETTAALEACKAEAGGEWDDEELYPVVETLLPHFPNLRFEAVSFCAGVLLFEKERTV